MASPYPHCIDMGEKVLRRLLTLSIYYNEINDEGRHIAFERAVTSIKNAYAQGYISNSEHFTITKPDDVMYLKNIGPSITEEVSLVLRGKKSPRLSNWKPNEEHEEYINEVLSQ